VWYFCLRWPYSFHARQKECIWLYYPLSSPWPQLRKVHSVSGLCVCCSEPKTRRMRQQVLGWASPPLRMHTHTQTHRHTDTQTDTPTHPRTHTPTHPHTHTSPCKICRIHIQCVVSYSEGWLSAHTPRCKILYIYVESFTR
jgi:hypothetical protein